MSNATWAAQRFCSHRCARKSLQKSPAVEFEARFIPEPNTGCWIWTAPLSTQGYGWFRCNGQRMHAHRFSLQHFKGPIPEGLYALHTCDNRWCVNPEHLYAGTQSENIRDCVTRGRHFTPHGARTPSEAI
jgi:hypothetical protein